MSKSNVIFSPEWEIPIAVAGAAQEEKYGDLAATNKTYPFLADMLPGSIEIVWTGNPVGAFTLFGSMADTTHPPPWIGPTWNNLSPVAIPAIPDSAGAGGSHLILLNNTRVKWLYLNVNRTSGAGAIIVRAGRSWA